MRSIKYSRKEHSIAISSAENSGAGQGLQTKCLTHFEQHHRRANVQNTAIGIGWKRLAIPNNLKLIHYPNSPESP